MNSWWQVRPMTLIAIGVFAIVAMLGFSCLRQSLDQSRQSSKDLLNSMDRSRTR